MPFLVTKHTSLVPIVGIVSSVVTLGEPLQRWKLISGLLVMSSRSIKIKIPQQAFQEFPPKNLSISNRNISENKI